MKQKWKSSFRFVDNNQVLVYSTDLEYISQSLMRIRA